MRIPHVRGISPIVAAIILISIAVVGGLVVFAIWNNFANIEAQKTQVSFEYLALYKGLGEPKAVFAATLKNTGSKPIKSLVIKLHNESAYQIPSVTELSPLAPGRSTGVTLTPPLIHADWYVVGMSYTVTIFSVAVDGSTFSHTASVMCMGQESGGLRLQRTTFEVVGLHTYGDILTVDGVRYSYSDFPVVLTWPANTVHSFAWARSVEEAATWTGKRYGYDYCLVDGEAGVFLDGNEGALTVGSEDITVYGYYCAQYALNVTIVGSGTVVVNSSTVIGGIVLTGSTSVTRSEVLWYGEGRNLTISARPTPSYAFGYWALDGVNQTADLIGLTMSSPHDLLVVFLTPSRPANGYDALIGIRPVIYGGYDALIGIKPVIYGSYDALIRPWCTVYGGYDAVVQGYRQLTILVSGSGYTYPPAGNHSYPVGAVVYVEARPHEGNRFVRWELDGNAAGSRDYMFVDMHDNHVLTAYFEPIPKHTLMISVNDPSMGTTSPSPGTYAYYEGTAVSVSATSNVGYRLARWELDGANAGSASAIRVTMDADHVLTAYFEPFNVTVTFSASGVAPGLSVLQVDGVDYSSSALPLSFTWPSMSAHSFAWRSPIPGGSGCRYVWDRTSGLSAARVGIVATDRDGQVSAAYHAEYALSISASPPSMGTTSPAPGTHWYAAGSTVGVEAIPSIGFQLSSWTVDGSPGGSSGSIAVTMNAPHSVTASFEQVSLEHLADKLAIMTGIGWLYIAPYSYPWGFIDPPLRDYVTGIQITFQVWSALSGKWSAPVTVSLGDSSITRQGQCLRVWNAYVHLSTGNTLQIKYQGSDTFYLYYDPNTAMTRATAQNPVG